MVAVDPEQVGHALGDRRNRDRQRHVAAEAVIAAERAGAADLGAHPDELGLYVSGRRPIFADHPAIGSVDERPRVAAACRAGRGRDAVVETVILVRKAGFAAAGVAGEPAIAVIGQIDALSAGAGLGDGIAPVVIADAAQASRRSDTRELVGALGVSIGLRRGRPFGHRHVHTAHGVIAIDRRTLRRHTIVDAGKIAVGVIHIGQGGKLRIGRAVC